MVQTSMTKRIPTGPRCRDCGKPMELDRGICPECQAAGRQEGPTPPDHPLWGLLDATKPRPTAD